ncbi:hypothetical protein M427DRAFT_134000 [Gonapodya prolifera JEL478]|uniref:C2H2-type domain-containing protein n=1 Tax=Gonapodya prolifera (strain JEL478) TaxID=1344416 RepID=A0A139AIQ5_GONPJ|nr:hypothetical protein M427DRAFT_134000 [Gonapodya prolifera JEL478]|eukprot:KXS16670.1 hypothetical protein M427DRAFT_134000 [Gonapodya prolifera JEL478]
MEQSAGSEQHQQNLAHQNFPLTVESIIQFAFDSRPNPPPDGNVDENGLPQHGPTRVRKDSDKDFTRKKFVCPQGCGASFAKKFNLDTHMLTHQTGRPKIPCDYGCGCEFYRRSDLVRHRKMHELGHKPHVCSRCGKDFARQDRMRTHEAKCTGTAPEQKPRRKGRNSRQQSTESAQSSEAPNPFALTDPSLANMGNPLGAPNQLVAVEPMFRPDGTWSGPYHYLGPAQHGAPVPVPGPEEQSQTMGYFTGPPPVDYPAHYASYYAPAPQFTQHQPWVRNETYVGQPWAPNHGHFQAVTTSAPATVSGAEQQHFQASSGDVTPTSWAVLPSWDTRSNGTADSGIPGIENPHTRPWLDGAGTTEAPAENVVATNDPRNWDSGNRDTENSINQHNLGTANATPARSPALPTAHTTTAASPQQSSSIDAAALILNEWMSSMKTSGTPSYTYDSNPASQATSAVSGNEHSGGGGEV